MIKDIELSSDSDSDSDSGQCNQKAIGSKPVKLLADDRVTPADVHQLVASVRKSLGWGNYHPSTKTQILIALIAEGIISDDVDRLREEVFNSKLVSIPTSNEDRGTSNEYDYSKAERGPPDCLVGSRNA